MGLFEEYKNHPDKDVRERANNWGAAIGLQNVDGLSVSEFLIQLARQQIEGEITMDEVTQRLNEHYEHSKLYGLYNCCYKNYLGEGIGYFPYFS